MDKIFIKGFKIPATIGLLPEEKKIKQEIEINLEVAVNVAIAATQDDINFTIDYANLCQHIKDFVSASSFQLIETLAEKLAQSLLQKFHLPWLRLSLTKHPRDISELVHGAGVIIERELNP